MRLEWESRKNACSEEVFVARAGDIESCVEYDEPGEDNGGVGSWWWWNDVSDSNGTDTPQCATKEEAMAAAEEALIVIARDILYDLNL